MQITYKPIINVVKDADKRIESLEMEKNRTSIVLRNIAANSLDNMVLLRRILELVKFSSEDDGIESIRSFFDKNGYKRLEIRFFSLKRKIDFTNLFYCYGTLRNLDVIQFNVIQFNIVSVAHPVQRFLQVYICSSRLYPKCLTTFHVPCIILDVDLFVR